MKVEIKVPKTTFGRTLYSLLEPLTLCDIDVPKGFITDGASIPRGLWWLFPPVGRYFKAAVVHDYLLTSGSYFSYANLKFRDALEEQGVKPWVTFLMYHAVVIHFMFKKGDRYAT